MIGDALCSFNPVYAQGMTVAALEALALGSCVVFGTDRLGQRFFRRTPTIVDDAWRVPPAICASLASRASNASRCASPTGTSIGCTSPPIATPTSPPPFQRVVNMLAPPSTLHVAPHWSTRIPCTAHVGSSKDETVGIVCRQ